MVGLSEASELSPGYKLLPWSSWDQWNFVRESIFSSSHDSVAAALGRISAWRSRGCLPVPIDVTAAIVETQQKDPFFREGAVDNALISEEMLAMLYCMAIMRLVNGFVEPAHKKTGRSISELADAVGIPRMLVDIRHESSHRDLPSLRLVRLASMKALDWLKSNYWEPQRNAIPDVRREIRSKLREMMNYLKTKHSQKMRSSQIKGIRAKRSAVLRGCNKLSSQIIGKLQSCKSDGSEKQISRISKIIARLYSAYPSEVVSALLEFFQLQAPDFYEGIDSEHSDNSKDGDPGLVRGSIYELKTIITKLSSKKPRLLLSILKTVLEMLEVKESEISEWSEFNFLSSQYQAEMCQIKYLCSLVPWLLMNLKALKDSGQIGFIDETQVLSAGKNAAPRVSLTKLLNKCLTLSVLGDEHLSNSVLLLAEMIGNRSLSEKLKKLPLLGSANQDFTEKFTSLDTESMLLREEDSIEKAGEKLELLKLRLRNRKIKRSSPTDGNADTVSGMWTVARSWIPCPIGMLPCSFSSSALLPILDKSCDVLETGKIKTKNEKVEVNHAPDTSEAACNVESLENGSAVKKLKQTLEEQIYLPETAAPMEGLLLIDGVWKKVSEEELLALESNVRIFA